MSPLIAKRLLPGQDVRLELERLVSTEHIVAGCSVSIVGSLVRACFRLADGKHDKMFDGPFEIVSGTGTLSPDGIHIHLSVADEKGSVIGGHLRYGCIVNTTVELVVEVLEDFQFHRVPDAVTGYDELTIISFEKNLPPADRPMFPPLPNAEPGVYEHYSGRRYELVGVARHSETLEPLVVYRALYDDHDLWVRPFVMFFEEVEVDNRHLPRFRKIR